MGEHDRILSVTVIICAFLAAFRYVYAGLRAKVPDPCEERFSRAANARDRGATGVPDFLVAALLFATACALLVYPVPVAAAYAFLCLAISARLVVGLLVEERERSTRRRAALLQRSPRIDPVLAAWVGVAAASTALVLPSLLAGNDRISALAVTACCLAMTAVAWRIATAPALLSGDDVEAELLLDRTRRIRRTGLVCMIAIGSAFFFAVAAGEPPNYGYTGIFVWAMLGVWLFVYLRRLYRAPLPS